MSGDTRTDKRVAKIRADLPRALESVATVERALNRGDAAALAEAARFLEAFGCYVRRTDIGEVAS